jgi:hypothetical protein
MVKIENLVVLVCRDYTSHPEKRTEVLGVPDAIKRLGEDGLTLTITAGETWNIRDKNGSVLGFNPEVGSSREFNRFPVNTAIYLVGVYDSTNIRHLQNMADAVKYKEGVTRRASSAEGMD